MQLILQLGILQPVTSSTIGGGSFLLLNSGGHLLLNSGGGLLLNL